MVTFDQSTDESWGERLLPHQQGSRYHDSQQLQHGCRRCRWVVSASSRSGSTQGAAQDHAGLPLGLLIMEPSRSHSSAVPGASPACSHPHAAPRSCLFTCCVSPLRLSPAAQERSDEHVLTQSASVRPNHCVHRSPLSVRPSTRAGPAGANCPAPGRGQDLNLQEAAGSNAGPGPARTAAPPGTPGAPARRAPLLEPSSGGGHRPEPSRHRRLHWVKGEGRGAGPRGGRDGPAGTAAAPAPPSRPVPPPGAAEARAGVAGSTGRAHEGSSRRAATAQGGTAGPGPGPGPAPALPPAPVPAPVPVPAPAPPAPSRRPPASSGAGGAMLARGRCRFRFRFRVSGGAAAAGSSTSRGAGGAPPGA